MTSSLVPSSNPAYQTLPGLHDSDREIELPPKQEDAAVVQSVENDVEMNGEALVANAVPSDEVEVHLLQDGNVAELEKLMDDRKHLFRPQDVTIEFYDLNFYTFVDPERQIVTVSSVLWKLLTFWRPTPQKRVNILASATGRILPRKMTLLLGPPGSGKSGKILPWFNRILSY